MTDSFHPYQRIARFPALYASIEERPAAATYGIGPAWVNSALYWSNGVAWIRVHSDDYRTMPAYPEQNGTLCVNIGAGSTTISDSVGSNTKVSTAPFATAGGSAIQMDIGGNGTEHFDIDFPAFSINLSTDKFLGVWINRRGCAPIVAGGLKPLAITLYFTGDGFSSFSIMPMLIYPGSHFYAIPTSSASAWNQAVTSINKIRIRPNNAGEPGVLYGSGAGFYSAGNDRLFIGDFYKSPTPPKAKFLIGFDDCRSDLLNPGDSTTAIIGGDGVSKAHSFASFVASYGFRLNAWVVTGAVLRADTISNIDYLNARQLASGRDEWGICYGAHSHSHPNGGDIAGTSGVQGMRLLGPYGYAALGAGPYTFTTPATGLTVTAANDSSAIINDLSTCLDYLYKFGLGNATKYFALPQGVFDYYINSAIEQFSFKVVRGISNAVPFGAAYNTGRPQNGLELVPPELGASVSSVQIDTTTTEAALHAYVDQVIAAGAMGSSYIHSFASATASIRTNCKWLLDYLKVKSDAGLIDVVVLDDL